MRRLSDLHLGQDGVIMRYGSTDGFKLKELGLTEGAKIRLVGFAPFGDPLLFEVRGSVFALRRNDAGGIWIK